MATILIIDDSQLDLFSLKYIVEKGGHEVITAEDGWVSLNGKGGLVRHYNLAHVAGFVERVRKAS